MAVEIPCFPIAHAGIRPAFDPALGAEVLGRTAVRYLRFLREVSVERLECAPLVYGRWVPSVPTHPARLIVSTLDETSCRWVVARTLDIPPDPRISGEGLSPDMRQEEMEAHFTNVMETVKPHAVDLGGARTRALRVECDREHPTWPSHGECNGGPFNVPFGVLDSLKVFGPEPAEEIPDAEWNPVLAQGEIAPRAPRGMTVRRVGEMLLFEGRRLSAGFSLRRPVLLHLGWDAWGAGAAGRNRVAARRPRFRDRNRGASGPLLVDFRGDYGSHRWTGSVEARGSSVGYRGLRAAGGLSLDASFAVEPDRLVLALSQSAERDLPAIETEAWRFAFNEDAGMTGIAGVPTLAAGRSGDTLLPALLAGDGNGALSIRAAGGEVDRIRLQAESYRASTEVTAGIVLGERPAGDGCLIVPKGTVRAVVELRVTALEPASPPGALAPGIGTLRHWGSVFSCFRPELGGFSNNAVSVNCHQNQHGPIEVASFTRAPAGGPDPLALARFTVGRALMGGSGYGWCRNLYLDSDPVLLSAAGRIHQARPDAAWLRSVAAGLARAAERMLATMDPGTGLAVCRELSGNSGSFRWSCNAWDIVGFGHLDAYVNAWTYRGLRNAAALLDELGRRDLSGRCREAAAGMPEGFARHLVNPDTGWAACWRSRDGALHDYASPFINGPACAFGILSPERARRALAGLEALRDERGLSSAALGIPFTLRPMDPADHMMPALMGGGKTEPTFECYTDGSMGPSAAALDAGFVVAGQRVSAERGVGMKSWPRYLPDLTTWFSWHSERGTLPEKWREMDLPAICRDMGVPAWRALKPWRAEMPGVAVWTEKSDSERVVLWETERGTLRSRWTRGPDGDWWQAEYPVKSAADLPAARLAAEERRYAVDRETAERMSAEQASGGVGLLALALPLRPWSELFHTFLGWSEGLMLFLEQEEALREIVAVLETALAGLVAETARMPGAIVLSPDNLDGQFIAPSAFDEHLAPSYAKSAGVLHEAGKILVVHVGGPVRGLLPGLSRAGVDCVEGVCGPPQGDTPPAEARSLCGGDTTIWGGIAQDFLMQNRSEADFQAAADAAFAFAKHDPKTVVGVADRVPVDALPERLEALARMR